MELTRTKKILEIAWKRGLRKISQTLDAEIFSTGSISIRIGKYQPDVIETTTSNKTTEINVISIKNTIELKKYHFLQSFVYKLALEEAIKKVTIKPCKVTSSVIYWDQKYYHDPGDGDHEGFMPLFSSDLFFVEFDLTDHERVFCTSSLEKIASLEPKEKKSDCVGCVGVGYCDIHEKMDR